MTVAPPRVGPFVTLLAALAAFAAAGRAPALAAATPPPHPVPIPTGKLSKVPEHVEVVVEVNKKGQVVRIKSGKPSKNMLFNTQTYGNALQMWIRKPDGSATVGLYRVTYDYDPKTDKIKRNITLVSTGGTWGDEEGAANAMMDTAKREAAEQQKRIQQMPSINQITGHSPSPSPSPHP